MATTPSQLATLASQYGQYDKLLSRWAMVDLLAQIAGVTVNAATLASLASQYGQLDNPLLADWAIIYLLQQIVTNGGTGGGTTGAVPTGNYGGGQPTFTPTTSGGVAIDTSNGRIWWYWSGAWH